MTWPRSTALLDDEAFFDPFRPFFDPVIGQPSVPIETYIRMMLLKYRYRLGFEPLCREVADSIAWRRFCRVPLGEAVPHPTTHRDRRGHRLGVGVDGH